ncbi:uncharacterized protein LOC128189998 [Crassostrea angulata]|uniref:uncharacterized protein LOC128189998 n=1 Tax=Magallana angulata TaxID=2784310 RepID=UPI0022B1FDA4|nr:uncharacterized protein LOC128189998 [Crassostrea angulata]XP_052717821.1 uncharacterized protein LOC128189998 [Crassostrea angulata]
MAWVTFKSPLWRKEIVQDKVKPLPSLKVKRKMEQEFVNDGVRTTNGTNRRKPIIPPYNALRDRYAQAYFQSPLVKAMKERNFHLKGLQESQANIRNLNKLSHRHRCIATPSIEEIRVREQTFVNDAIITERKRTKYKDIIPVYDASRDNHCLGYFKRPDVKHLVSITCTPTGSFSYDSKIKSPRRQKLRASAP